jgi:hypothetical protein
MQNYYMSDSNMISHEVDQQSKFKLKQRGVDIE